MKHGCNPSRLRKDHPSGLNWGSPAGWTKDPRWVEPRIPGGLNQGSPAGWAKDPRRVEPRGAETPRGADTPRGAHTQGGTDTPEGTDTPGGVFILLHANLQKGSCMVIDS